MVKMIFLAWAAGTMVMFSHLMRDERMRIRKVNEFRAGFVPLSGTEHKVKLGCLEIAKTLAVSSLWPIVGPIYVKES